ncbi:MAG: SH3 domain-containing protein [Devosia sp.]
MSPVVRLLLAAVVAVFIAAPVEAVQPIGTAAWTTEGWISGDGTLYAGPGTAYDVTGTIASGIRVRVDRCAPHWCLIHTKSLKGWVPLGDVAFGQTPKPWLVGRKFPTERGGSGDVCFYTGANFTGTELCAKSGRVFTDLALVGYDNAFSSVKVGSGVSAMVCRDRGFRSWCQTIDVDTAHLPGLLDNGVSSIRVY